MQEGHYHHFLAVYDSTENYVETYLPHNIQYATPMGVLPLQDGTGRQFMYLSYGNGLIANHLIIEMKKSANEVVSFFPAIEQGLPVNVKVIKALPWEDGLEGIWVCEWQDRLIQVYDPCFRVGLEKGIAGQQEAFVIAGFAYWLECVKDTIISVDSGAIWDLEKQRRLEEGMSEEEAAKPVEISTKGLGMLVQIREDSPADAEIRGTISAVQQFVFNDQSLWRIDILALNDEENGEKIAVPIFVRDDKLKEGYRPQVGDDVQGVVWMQGFAPKAREHLVAFEK